MMQTSVLMMHFLEHPLTISIKDTITVKSIAILAMLILIIILIEA